MGALSPILRSVEGDRLMFWCPGCDCAHMVRVGDGPSPRWSYNGNPDRPTFTPSILVSYPHWVPPAEDGKPAPERQTLVTSVCHSFVTDGRIQFLSDCTHALAGQTVDIPDFDTT